MQHSRNITLISVLFILGSTLCSAHAEKLILRSYPVVPGIGDVVVESALGKGDKFGDLGGGGSRFIRQEKDRIQKYYEECGVTFPEGSYIRFNEHVYRLFMKNTLENHRLLEYLLYLEGAMPTQIQLDTAFVSFPKEEIDKLAVASESAVPSIFLIKELRKKGIGKNLSASTILTRNGINVSMESVDEIIYTTEYSIPEGAANGDDEEGQSKSYSLAFETREVGTSINVTPTAGPGGEFIELTIAPELCEEPIWQKQEQIAHDLKQPQFHSRNLTTSIMVKNGSPLVMGGMASKDGKEITYLFLTATIVDAEGKPILVYDFDE